MNKVKCYVNELGDKFSDCVNAVICEVNSQRGRKNVIIIFDGIALSIDKSSTLKSVTHEYMIKSSRL